MADTIFKEEPSIGTADGIESMLTREDYDLLVPKLKEKYDTMFGDTFLEAKLEIQKYGGL